MEKEGVARDFATCNGFDVIGYIRAIYSHTEANS
jgi:hypothetical protein